MRFSQFSSYAKDIARNQGLSWLLKTGASHFAYFLYYKKIRKCPQSFTFLDKRYDYFVAMYHATYANERAVEIPIAMGLVEKYLGRRILEVGNVLSHYFSFPHVIVDKYEVAPGVTNEDIVEYSTRQKFDLVLSISTLEHVGWDETPQDGTKIIKALKNIKNLVNPGGLVMVTVPIGQNPLLDKLIREGIIKFDRQYYMKRISKSNLWEQKGWDSVNSCRSGDPFPGANAIIVGYDLNGV